MVTVKSVGEDALAGNGHKARTAPDAIAIRGVVAVHGSGHPVAGVGVQVHGRDVHADELLDATTTRTDGSFELTLRATGFAGDQATLLAAGRANLVVTAEVPGSRRDATATVAGVADLPLRIDIDLGREPAKAKTWRSIAAGMRKARIARVGALATELLAADGHSRLKGVKQAERLRAAAELERGFLDPTGHLGRSGEHLTFARATAIDLPAPNGDTKNRLAIATARSRAATFGALTNVDWVLDPDLLAGGAVTEAIDRFVDLYVRPDGDFIGAETEPGLGDLIDRLFRSPLAGYRDYLRSIFTGPTSHDRYGTLLEQLQGWFHQDFTTHDDTERPAAEVIFPIITAILEAPSGPNKRGFDIDGSSIEPQGARTDQEQLDHLLSLSGLTAETFALTFRLPLDVRPGVVTSPVAINVHTLQRFYTDDFQADRELFPLVSANVEAPPFFLFYEEWLEQQKPFHAENAFPMRETFRLSIGDGHRAKVKKEAEDGTDDPLVQFVGRLVVVEDQLATAHTVFDEGQFQTALEAYQEAERLASEALGFLLDSYYTAVDEVQGAVAELLAKPATTPKELVDLVGWFGSAPGDDDNWWTFKEYVEADRSHLVYAVVHLLLYGLPTFLGDCLLELGDIESAIDQYSLATRFLVSRETPANGDGWEQHGFSEPTMADLDSDYAYYNPWVNGGVPYGTPGARWGSFYFPYDQQYGAYSGHYSGTLAAELAEKVHPTVRKFVRLRHGNAVLEWADSLYRTGDAPRIQRARELYKAVLWLHEVTPPSVPRPLNGLAGLGGGWPGKVFFHFENPAMTSQLSRARLGLFQIEAGLNYYGWHDDVVPELRYRTLKDAADRFAAAAKAAEADFLHFVGKQEDLLRENLVDQNMLRKANLQAQIAAEQKGIAQFNVAVATKQVEVVEAQIDAKRKEIEEADGFFEQLTTFVGGMVDVVKGLPSAAVPSGGSLAAGTGMSSQGAAGITAASGGAVVGAYALFVYAGVTSMSNMAEADNSRTAQLEQLQNEALPMAKAQLEAKEREVKIADLQRAIADADADLARSLIAFDQSRMLNVRFWTELATVMKRVMRRYLRLGARFGWLAERALAFEQDQELRILRYDYVPARLQGATGAAMLQADLAELEAARLSGLRETVPVKRTFSVTFDQPLAMAQLRATGRCTFATDEAVLASAYPGTYGYRIRAVTVAARSYAGTPPPRGLLANLGISAITDESGAARSLLRFPDALPLSEFRLEEDLAVYGFPNEALMNFEGSGVTTVWSLELPAAANPLGLDDLADIEITIDATARYSARLHAVALEQPPAPQRRFVLLSAATLATEAVVDLRGESDTPTDPVELELLPETVLPAREENRVVTNVIVVLGGGRDVDATATLSAGGKSLSFPISGGAALSNGPPVVAPGASVPPQPLNALIGSPVEGPFVIRIAKASQPGTDWKAITDVVLGLEYTADVT